MHKADPAFPGEGLVWDVAWLFHGSLQVHRRQQCLMHGVAG